jgi:adenine-specific DNA methylase
MTLNDSFELPSLEEIEELDKQRSQAIESLQIFDHSVKCQKCGMAVPKVGNSRTIRHVSVSQKFAWLLF